MKMKMKNDNKLKIKYKILDARLNNDKVILLIKILDAYTTNDRNNDKEEQFDINSQTNRRNIEKGVYNHIITKYKGKVGSSQYTWSMDIDGEGNILTHTLPKNAIFDINFEY